ncbi:MAG: NAD-dependent epimerase/dehydratase family protein [Cyanobacterium sp.]
MKVLVTGIGGFVGSSFARLLVKKGYEVHGIVRKTTDLWRIQDILPSIHLFYADLQDYSQINTYLKELKPDWCIHLAWYAVPGKYLQSAENLNSLQASLNLVSQLAELGCQRFIGIGTCFEYDFSLGYLSESSPTKPLTLYAATKVALATTLSQLSAVTDMQTVWVRLFYQYGKRESVNRLIPAIICSLLKNEEVKTTEGEQIRDFLYIEDVASALLEISKSKLTGVVNIGSGQPMTVKEIALKIGKILDKSHLINFGALPYRANDPMFICANNYLLKKQTNWQIKYDWEVGIEQTINWYKQTLSSD